MDYPALLGQFARLYELQDVLSKHTEHEMLHAYGHADIHCIDAVGKLERPNVTALARRLCLTRGAVSKMTGRLERAGALARYRVPHNRKEVFFRLTPLGRALYEEHARRHALWAERDTAFLRGVDAATLETVSGFLAAFIRYLQQQVRDLQEENHAD